MINPLEYDRPPGLGLDSIDVRGVKGKDYPPSRRKWTPLRIVYDSTGKPVRAESALDPKNSCDLTSFWEQIAWLSQFDKPFTVLGRIAHGKNPLLSRTGNEKDEGYRAIFELGTYGNFSLAKYREVPAIKNLLDMGIVSLKRYGAFGLTIERRKKNTYYEDFTSWSGCDDQVFDPNELVDYFLAMEHVIKSLNLWVTDYVGTPAKVFERYIRLMCPEAFPQNNNTCFLEERWELYQYSHKCYRGGNWGSSGIGRPQHIISYDGNSAYAGIFFHLIDMQDCTWEKSSSDKPEAVYGFIRCRGSLNFRGLALIGIRTEEDVFLGRQVESVPMNGYFEELWMTKLEFDLIHLLRLGELRVIDGWYGTPRPIFEQPFKAPINKVFKLRNNSPKESLQELMYKLILARGTGKLGQNILAVDREHKVRHLTSSIFNPIYAAYMTAGVRCHNHVLLDMNIRKRREAASRLDGAMIFDKTMDWEEGYQGKDLGQFSYRKDDFPPGTVIINAVETLTSEQYDKALQGEGKIVYEDYVSERTSKNFKDVGNKRKKEVSFEPNPGLRKIERLPTLEEAGKRFFLTQLLDNQTGNIIDQLSREVEIDEDEELWSPEGL